MLGTTIQVDITTKEKTEFIIACGKAEVDYKEILGETIRELLIVLKTREAKLEKFN